MGTQWVVFGSEGADNVTAHNVYIRLLSVAF